MRNVKWSTELNVQADIIFPIRKEKYTTRIPEMLGCLFKLNETKT